MPALLGVLTYWDAAIVFKLFPYILITGIKKRDVSLQSKEMGAVSLGAAGSDCSWAIGVQHHCSTFQCTPLPPEPSSPCIPAPPKRSSALKWQSALEDALKLQRLKGFDVSIMQQRRKWLGASEHLLHWFHSPASLSPSTHPASTSTPKHRDTESSREEMELPSPKGTSADARHTKVRKHP